MIPLLPPLPPATRVALIGASGFIGLRTTEILGARPDFRVTPVVRSPSSLAVLARQSLDWKICAFTDPVALGTALRGADACVHAAIGDPAQIVRMAAAAYRACAAAGVRRLVWLSSASVHGQNCDWGSDESSPLHDHHPLRYPNAKVRAEWCLQRLARDGRVTVVLLRPGVVFGPRSRWITEAAAGIAAGRAALHYHGRGICNSIYVDNLVEAIRLAATVPGLASGPLLVGDAETVMWRDFLLPIAWHLGRDESVFANLPPRPFAPERERLWARLTFHPAYARLTRLMSGRTKRVVKALVQAWRPPAAPADPWSPRPAPAGPQLTPENSLLQQCSWKLPLARAQQELGYAPPVTFAAGLRHSLAWLDFAEGRA